VDRDLGSAKQDAVDVFATPIICMKVPTLAATDIDAGWAGGNPDLLRAYAAELVALKPDALHVFSTPGTAALQ
jgi:hypothetical protein